MSGTREVLAAKFRRSGWAPVEGLRQDLVATAATMTDVVDLSLGDPDLPTPPNVVEAGIQALRSGLTHYTPNAGIPELRGAIAERLAQDYGLEIDPQREVAVTHGCAEASFVALQTFLDPGDEVLLGNPYFPGHVTAIIASGGVPVFVPTFPEDRFMLSAQEIAGKLTSRTKVLLLVSPHNPTGAVLNRQRLEAIAEVARERDLIVISDEIYEKLVFPPHAHVSFATLPSMKERTITVSGFSKSYCMTGWRVGYMVAPALLMRHLLQVRRATSICTSPMAQYAALEALSPRTEPHLREIVATFGERRRVFLAGLDRIGVAHTAPGGSFFVMVDIRPSGMTSAEAAKMLLRDSRILAWPSSMFGTQGEGFLRVALIEDAATLAKVVDRFGALLAPA